MRDGDKTVAILHHAGGGNLGDDAIIEAVIDNIRRRWPGVKIIIFSMNPDDSTRRHGVSAYPIRCHRWCIGYKSAKESASTSYGRSLLRTLRQACDCLWRVPASLVNKYRLLANSCCRLKPCDLLVITGGGQLTERGGPWSFPFALFLWTLLARALDVRCLFLNVGAGPLNHPVSRFFAKRALLASDYVSFHNQRSQSLARDLGFPRITCVFPDNVFSLEVEAPAKRGAGDEPIVGIAPMPFPFFDMLTPPRNREHIQNEFIEKMAHFSSRVAAVPCQLRLFGSDIGADPPEIEHLRTVLRCRHGLSLPAHERASTVGELLSSMAAMDYVVTCRFHGVAFALLLNKPVLAISHHPKVAELMTDLDLSRFCVEMKQLDTEELFEKFLALIRESDQVRQSISASVTRFRSRLVVQFDDLFSAQLEHAAIQNVLAPHIRPVVIVQKQQ